MEKRKPWVLLFNVVKSNFQVNPRLPDSCALRFNTAVVQNYVFQRGQHGFRYVTQLLF